MLQLDYLYFQINKLITMIFSFLKIFVLVIILGIYLPFEQVQKHTSDSFKVSIYTYSDKICYGDSLCLSAEAKGGSGDYNYIWYSTTECHNYHSQKIIIYPKSSLWIFVIATDKENHNTSKDSLFIEYALK